MTQPAMQCHCQRAKVPAPVVLIADDDPDVRAVAAMVVEQSGFKPILACDGLEALKLVYEHKPPIVLTDALMPKLDGRELCRHIKSDPQLAGTSVILMTGVYRSTQQRTEAFRQFRIDRFLLKPIDPALLVQTLDQLRPRAAAIARERLKTERLSGSEAASRFG